MGPKPQGIKGYMDWLFKDLHGRKGGYVIAEAPNKPLIAFMILIVLAVISYPGFWQSGFSFLAYIALAWWGWLESRGGRSRFRKLLGWGSLIALVGAVALGIGF
jgi:hypothetical protein